MKTINIGDVVVSKQGRDVGTHYIVIGILQDNYYICVNGDNKKFANPKRKIKKHIDKINKSVDNIKTKLETNVKVFDSEIYSALKKIKNEENL